MSVLVWIIATIGVERNVWNYVTLMKVCKQIYLFVFTRLNINLFLDLKIILELFENLKELDLVSVLLPLVSKIRTETLELLERQELTLNGIYLFVCLFVYFIFSHIPMFVPM